MCCPFAEIKPFKPEWGSQTSRRNSANPHSLWWNEVKWRLLFLWSKQSWAGDDSQSDVSGTHWAWFTAASTGQHIYCLVSAWLAALGSAAGTLPAENMRLKHTESVSASTGHLLHVRMHLQRSHCVSEPDGKQQTNPRVPVSALWTVYRDPKKGI